MTAPVRIRLAGVTFADGYPRNLVDLARRLLFERIDIDLVRELDNAHDLNAISVQVEGRHLGHIPAWCNEPIARDLDAGIPWGGQIAYIAVDPEHRSRPGLEVELFVKAVAR